MPPPVCDAQDRADSGLAATFETRAIGTSVGSAVLIADGLFGVIFGSYELAQPDGACIERSLAGACIQTQSRNADARMLAGLALGAGVAFAAVGVVLAFVADDYFRQLARVRPSRSASVELVPWASLDDRGGVAGWVMRW